jgi:hypothetical protein
MQNSKRNRESGDITETSRWLGVGSEKKEKEAAKQSRRVARLGREKKKGIISDQKRTGYRLDRITTKRQTDG